MLRKDRLLLAALCTILLAPHILSFNSVYSSVEQFYVDAATQVARYGFSANLSDYGYGAANPMFTSLLLSIGVLLFGDAFWVGRLTILFFCLVLIVVLYLYLKKKENVGIAFVALLLVVVNPVFITFAQQTQTDAPYVVLSSLAFLLVLYSTSHKEEVMSAVVLGLSLATKYVSATFFPAIAAYVFMRNRFWQAVKFNAWYFVVAGAVALPIILIVQLTGFGHLLVPNFSLFVPRFLSYLMWFGIFVGGMIVVVVYDLARRIRWYRTALIIVWAVLFTSLITHWYPLPAMHLLDVAPPKPDDMSLIVPGLVAPYNSPGEMNLMGLESHFSEGVLGVGIFVALVVAEVFIYAMITDVVRTRSNKWRALCLWMLVPLVAMSLTRPAQRYLMTVLMPLSLYLAFVVNRSHPKSWFIRSVVVVHSLVFLAAGSYPLFH